MSDIQVIELHDWKDPESLEYKAPPGLTEETVRMISTHKKEPAWMLEKRLRALEMYHELKMPTWGPALEKLELEKITYFQVPKSKQNVKSWEDLPDDIKKTFEKLGIPEAEKKSLSGVGSQYESVIVYHNIKKELEDQGVIFEDMDIALQKYPELVKKYFMTCVPVTLHKFTALHGAVWSGGTFIFIPKGVKVEMPLQAYFRMNAERGGQFEHTLIIVEEEAEISYIEGCFTKGTNITTNNGLVPIEQIQKGISVLTHTGRYKKVYHTQKRKYTGNMYTIQFYGDSTATINVTEEHPFLTVKRQKERDRNKEWKPEWRTPNKLSTKDYLSIPKDKTIRESPSHTFTVDQYDRKNKKYKKEKIIVPLTKEFFKLVGYYLAEGSISGGYYLNFSFGSTEKEYIQEVQDILWNNFKMKSKAVKHKKNHGITVVANSVKLCRIFKDFGTRCDKKNIPSWMIKESTEKQKQIIFGIFNGDGNYYKKRTTSQNWLKESFRINTTSERLARQLRGILLRLNIASFLNKRTRASPRMPIYTVGVTGDYLKPFGEIVHISTQERINGKKRASMFFVDDNYHYVPVKSISKRKVKNFDVYNFSVEQDESYVAEGVAVHNCSAPQYSTSSLHAGCVEVIVKRKARARYSSVESWSKNTYNLNTKRATVEEDGIMEWIGGNLGSACTMLYPCTILKGDRSRTEHIAIAFAGKGQNQDTGAKIYHIGKNTSSHVTSKSISIDGGITSYRGIIHSTKSARNVKSAVECDALMIDNKSQSNTYPVVKVENDSTHIAHEATVGRINPEKIFYLTSRGIKEEDAKKLIVSGFIEPITKQLPMEYAVELNKLIELEMEGSLG